MDLRQGTCSSCAHTFRVPATFTSDKVRCPKCKAVVVLPPSSSPAAAGGASSAKRPARARAAAAQAEPDGTAEHAGASGGRHHHARRHHHAPAKKSPLPFVIGGVALVALIGAVVAFNRGGEEETQAAAPAVVAKPDFSAMPDLAPAEGTSEQQWAEMNQLMDRYIQPPWDKGAEKAGDQIMHRGKPAVPAILNAFKRLDFTTQEGTDVGWKMQTLLLQGLCKVNYGWARATRAEEIASNMKVIERWRAAWNKAQLDDAAWEEIAKEAGTPGAQ